MRPVIAPASRYRPWPFTCSDTSAGPKSRSSSRKSTIPPLAAPRPRLRASGRFCRLRRRQVKLGPGKSVRENEGVPDWSTTMISKGV